MRDGYGDEGAIERAGDGAPQPVECCLERAAHAGLDDEQGGDDGPPALRQSQELHHREGGDDSGDDPQSVAQFSDMPAGKGERVLQFHRFSSRIPLRDDWSDAKGS